MALKPYKTLMKRAHAEFIVNKSRFIGHAAPAEDEDEALKFLADIRAMYKDASHNCYAYILGANMGVMRYSDDGEPGGTAGMPIIENIKSRDITNCALVVTRYFGGVKLGAGGLVRAYSRAASEAIDAAGVGTIYPTARYMLTLAYPTLGRAEHFLKSQDVIIEDKAFADGVTLTLSVRARDEDEFISALVSALDARVEYLRVEEMYMAWEK